MAAKLFLIALSWSQLLSPGRAACLKSASTCGECVLSGPRWAWCADPHVGHRCHTRGALRRAGCDGRHVYDPRGSLRVTRNDSGTELASGTLSLQPQELSLHLRPGFSQSFPLRITTTAKISELTMDTSPLPAGLNVTFGDRERGNILVEVNVDPAHCHTTAGDVTRKNKTGPWSVRITPRGFSQSVKLEIRVECGCDCKEKREENSRACNGRGALVCGSCECYRPYHGRHCQMERELRSDRERFCREGPNAPLCSGRGTCVDGTCSCQSRDIPNERYTGRFCECSNFDCPYYNNSICSGHGKCECGRCVCDDDWVSEDCGCSLDTTSCTASNRRLCNGKGMCQCGVCRCEPPYAGPTCESCPTCSGHCQLHAECVECRAFGTGPKKDRCEHECDYLILTAVASKEDIRAPCRKISREDSCFFYYGISQTAAGTHCTVANVKDCPQWK